VRSADSLQQGGPSMERRAPGVDSLRSVNMDCESAALPINEFDNTVNSSGVPAGLVHVDLPRPGLSQSGSWRQGVYG